MVPSAVQDSGDAPEETTIARLSGTKSEGNLKDAFAGECQANRRYLSFARGHAATGA